MTSVEADGILRAPKLDVPKDVQRMWGQYSPWRAAGTYVGPPEGCNVTQVSLCTVRSLCTVDLRCAFHSMRCEVARCEGCMVGEHAAARNWSAMKVWC